MKAMPVILAGIAIVAVALLGFGSTDDRQSIEGVDVAPTAEPNEVKRVVPETFSASQTVYTADSREFEAVDVRISQQHDVPGLVQEADARVVEEITSNVWIFDGVNVDGYAPFDSTGNIFAHDEYQVAMIDTINNTQTTWIAPEGWRLADEYFGDISSSGQYYFIANGNISSLDPDTGVFTQWDVSMSEYDDDYYNNRSLHSIGDSIYFSPDYEILAENHDDYFDVTHVYSENEQLVVIGVGAIGHVDIEVVSPANVTHNDDDNASSHGTFVESFYVFSNEDNLSDEETGTYTVRVTNQNMTIEKELEITGLPFEFGDENISPPYVFVQKLTPASATITSYHVDGLHSNEFYLKPDSLNDSLYFDSHNESNDLEGIMQFEPDTLNITHWPDIDNDGYHLGVSHDGDDLYWGYNTGRDILKIVHLNTQSGVLTENITPHECHGDVRAIAVDSLDNVFFYGCEFYKYVPATNTFVSFGDDRYRLSASNFRIDASDVMYWNYRESAGTATYAARIVQPEVDYVEIDTLTTIRIQTDADTDLIGTPQSSDFTVSNNTVSSVDLDDEYIVVTVGTPILPGDETVTISYSGLSIGDGTAQLEPFTEEEIDNAIEPNILDISTTSATQIRITADNVLQWDDMYKVGLVKRF